MARASKLTVVGLLFLAATSGCDVLTSRNHPPRTTIFVKVGDQVYELPANSYPKAGDEYPHGEDWFITPDYNYGLAPEKAIASNPEISSSVLLRVQPRYLETESAARFELTPFDAAQRDHWTGDATPVVAGMTISRITMGDPVISNGRYNWYRAEGNVLFVSPDGISATRPIRCNYSPPRDNRTHGFYSRCWVRLVLGDGNVLSALIDEEPNVEELAATLDDVISFVESTRRTTRKVI